MITYRQWTEGDIPTLKALVAALHDYMRPFDENYPPATQIIDRYFAYLLEDIAETAGTFFVAEDDGRIIGCASVFGRMPPFTPDEDPRPLTFVSDLYVDPGYRGRGIGKGLLAQAEAYGTALGTARIELAVHAANPALAVYQHQGYRQRMVIMTKRLD